ncbi:MAG TPA: ABC transporter ATP-binding protein, partial [Anaerolineae bacterium]|nr:ABC transporter ATP-binding protein [Anaerolineae bacterium]
MTMPRSKRGKRQKTSFKPLWRAVTYVGHYKNMTLLAYAAIFVSVAAQLMVPQMVQMILDAVTNGMIAQQLANIPSQFLPMALEKLGWTMAQYDQFSNNAETAIFWSAGLIVAFAVARAGFSFAQTFLSQVMSQNVAFDFRNELYAKIQRLSFSYHDRNQTGQLMVRATDDVEKVRRFIGQGMVMALQAVIMLTGTLIILFLTNAKLTLIILPIMPIALFMFMVFGKITQPMFVEVQRRLSRLNAILQENMAGIKVVKAFARNPEEKAKFERSADDYMAQQLKVVRIFSFLFPIVFLVVNLGQAAVLYFGGKQIIYGDLTLGQWQKFSLYLVYVFFPLGQLGFIISQMSQAAASAKRIFDILDARNEVVEKPHAIELSTIEGCVTFDDVTFRYYPEGEPVLSHVSF